MSLETIEIISHRGKYTVNFRNELFGEIVVPGQRCHYILDQNVARLYSRELSQVLDKQSHILVDANEKQKEFGALGFYIDHLLKNGIKREHVLVAVGGGVIQDITSFLASVLFRGMPWIFYPTTLLAQADSCIGSKSSINFASTKNLLGTFHPPQKIILSPAVLKTLSEVDLRSGIGEITKVHIIDGIASFQKLAADYDGLLKDQELMARYIKDSLAIKKKIIEEDEFDTGLRNILNYGHSFGHAIESATEFRIPHGIAVTIGMDMANFVALKMNRIELKTFHEMHSILQKNYKALGPVEIPSSNFLSALGKDKKNTSDKLGLILPKRPGSVEKVLMSNNEQFSSFCLEYLSKVWQ